MSPVEATQEDWTEDSLLAAASKLWGGHRLTPLPGPRYGSGRSLVVRAAVDVDEDDLGSSHPETVVVKGFNAAADPSAWARESAALEVLTGSSAPAPQLLADRASIVVMTDLGTGRSLADELLDVSPAAADTALHSWSAALGALHAATVGRRAEFGVALAKRAPTAPIDTSEDQLANLQSTLPELLGRLGLDLDASVFSEISDVDHRFRTDASALTPSDACPDNNLRTVGGLSLIDFEGATFRHLAWDAAYLTVPWPSCWCSWRLPKTSATAALDTWRSTVRATVPEVDSDDFRHDLGVATLLWTMVSVSWFLPATLEADFTPAAKTLAGKSPARRQFLLHRLEVVLADPPVGYERTVALVRRLHDVLTRDWGSVPLPLAPAYR